MECRNVELKIKDFAKVFPLRTVTNLRDPKISLKKAETIKRTVNKSPTLGAALSNGIKVIVHDVHTLNQKSIIMVADGALRTLLFMRFKEWALEEQAEQIGEQKVSVTLISGLSDEEIVSFVKSSNDHRKITSMQAMSLSGNFTSLVDFMKADGRLTPINPKEAGTKEKRRDSYLLKCFYAFFEERPDYKTAFRKLSRKDWAEVLNGRDLSEYKLAVNFLKLAQNEMKALPKERDPVKAMATKADFYLQVSGGIMSCLMHAAGKIAREDGLTSAAQILGSSRMKKAISILEKHLKHFAGDVNATCNHYVEIDSETV